MNIPKPVLYIGGGLAAYVVLKPMLTKAGATIPKATNSTIPTSQASLLTPGAPNPPAVYDGNYYLAYEYPAMVKANPNVTNSAYNLTDGEATQYMANYLDISQYANAPSSIKNFGSALNAARKHWHDHGVAEKRTFMPLQPPFTVPFKPAPANGGSSGGGSWVTDALSVATTIFSFLGSDDLNDRELELLFNGGGVMYDVLPMFYDADPVVTTKIKERLDDLLTKYSQ